VTRSFLGPAGLFLALLMAASACTGGGSDGHASPGPSGGTGTARIVQELRIGSAGFGLPNPVQREVAVAAGRLVYLAGGLNAAERSVAAVFTLDPSTGHTAEVGSMPQAFHDAAGAMIGRRLFVFGGGTGESSDAVQTFDTVSHATSVAGHLPHPLSDLQVAVVNGTVYLVGGWDGTAYSRTIYATADGLHFRTAGQLPAGIRYPAVAAVGDSIVVVGGMTPAGPTDAVSIFDTKSGRTLSLGRLPVPVGHGGAFSLGGLVYMAGGQDGSGHAVSDVVSIDPATKRVASLPPLAAPLSDPGVVATGGRALLIGGWRQTAVNQVLQASLETVTVTPPPSPVGASAASLRPFAGLLLIADRGNNRLLVMDASKHIVWRYPDPALPPPPFRFYFPDDAFWVHGGNAILVSEEENDVVQEIAYPSGRTIWSYGHAGIPGSAAGYLDQPDDAYPYPGGGAIVADAKNCRIVFFDAKGNFARQIGMTASADVAGDCHHALPDHVAYPNGATPLPNGHVLISELRGGGWLDEVTSDGHPVWQTHVAGIHLPSDPQRLLDGSFLTVDYETPGRIIRFASDGRVLWDYDVASGSGVLSNPSLAAPLPNGLVAVNDDFNHRVVLIDPATKAIVWQYGVKGVAGTGQGYLRIPDGLDLLLPGGLAPLHVDFATTTVTQGRP
jgi:hypothetical protein